LATVVALKKICAVRRIAAPPQRVREAGIFLLQGEAKNAKTEGAL